MQIVLGIHDEAGQSPAHASCSIWTKHGVYGEALIAFVVSKHAILEELIGLFRPGFVFNSIKLIVDDPNPGADAGQSPHLKLYICVGKGFQNPDVQSCCRTASA